MDKVDIRQRLPSFSSALYQLHKELPDPPPSIASMDEAISVMEQADNRWDWLFGFCAYRDHGGSVYERLLDGDPIATSFYTHAQSTSSDAYLGYRLLPKGDTLELMPMTLAQRLENRRQLLYIINIAAFFRPSEVTTLRSYSPESLERWERASTLRTLRLYYYAWFMFDRCIPDDFIIDQVTLSQASPDYAELYGRQAGENITCNGNTSWFVVPQKGSPQVAEKAKVVINQYAPMPDYDLPLGVIGSLVEHNRLNPH